MSLKFTTVDWAEGANIYEVNVRQYTPEGSFNAFAKHIDRLQDMGVKILWFMPVTPISEKGRQGSLGSYYATRDYTAINAEFGTIEDFTILVKKAHAAGMKVIIDWVANHTGLDHPWTIEHPDWYMKDEHGNFTEENGWADVIDLNYDNAAMRTAMIEAMQFWIKDCDIDGFRCDMAHLVPLDFWMDARTACDAVKPLLWLAECDEHHFYDAFDITYAWGWMHVSEKFFKYQSSFADFMRVLTHYAELPKGAKKLLFTSNHDENSWNGTEYEKYNGAAKALAVLTCTWPGLPLVYSGQELPNYKRLKFFDKDIIEWNEQPALRDFYKTLLALKANNKALHDNSTLINLSPGNNKVLAYFLMNGEQQVLVMMNLSADDRTRFTISHEAFNGKYKNLFSEISFDFSGYVNFELQGWEYFVYVKTNED